uniref:Candidate secreted effector n=1 Tax=Meloidogyne incognita TaxID=6306 RepID=A0A914N9S5_MELIC
MITSTLGSIIPSRTFIAWSSRISRRSIRSFITRRSLSSRLSSISWYSWMTFQSRLAVRSRWTSRSLLRRSFNF